MVSIEERFQFDLAGFIILRGVLSRAECDELLNVLRKLEGQDYEDLWLQKTGGGRPTKETNRDHQTRLNGLPRLHDAFDQLIDHDTLMPYLNEFVGAPQLINTWSISKARGAAFSSWHRGVPTTDYAYRNGDIRTRMFNTVWFLTDNGPDDGCVVAVPGSHKSNIDIDLKTHPAYEMPNATPITGKAGDLVLFSEATLHDGLPKTTDGTRTNLYYNYVHEHYNVMYREPRNCHHFYFPPDIRARLTDRQKELTAWMELARWDY
tara:strand:- start:1597 stop:2385 length:789 start_codon:yes stop_codon:yes gene_type:complete